MIDKQTEIISFKAIRERDTDMLLLEELKCNRSFSDWFLKKTLNRKMRYKFVEAWHSITHSGLGESDIVFKIRSNKETVLFLIENKLDTAFMPDQAKRYRKRGDDKLSSGECTSYYTVLFAPASYIHRNDDFDFYLEYEEVRDWFMSDNGMGDRGKFKADILKIAIERLRRGYTAIINKDTTKFKWDYYIYIERNYPFLKMKRPKEQMPKRTGFMRFQPDGLGLRKNEYLIHKKRGDVDLQLSETKKGIKIKYRKLLLKGMEIVKTGKSYSIRLKTTPIDIEGDFEEQLPEIKEAIKKVIILYDWAKKNLKNYRRV